jgi:hypothetical protein
MGRRFALINADKKNLPRMNAKRRESSFLFLDSCLFARFAAVIAPPSGGMPSCP